jgi:subtilase family serine protease
VRASLKLFALAGAVAVVAAASPAQARTHRAHASPRMATLAGSASRSLAGANVIGHAAPSSSVDISVFLKPRHPKLLARLAAQSSARPGLSAKMTNFLFRPSAAQRAQLSAYMRSQGFRLTGQGMLVSSFRGNAAQAQRAFGVSLAQYRGADGRTFRAPTGAVHLPASIAGHVLYVDGLSTQVRVHPAGLVRKHAHLQPNALNDCVVADNFQNSFGGFQPQDLAAAGAYNSQTLLDNFNDGTGESIALVEFSGGNANALSRFTNCYGLSVPNTRVNVNGGTANTAGSVEVNLDQEVAMSQAPGLDHLWTYVAKPSASQAAVLDAMLSQRKTRHIHIVSDSWGLCQLFEPLGEAASTNQELELMAVNGISFFSASGDDGSSDCHRQGINDLAVDDPAGQPYATGVGGTQLTATGPIHENVWGGHGVSRGAGGGGVAVLFRKPSWQKGPGVIRTGLSSKKKCGGKTNYCREVPDISFDADPQTGYIINDNSGWDIVGGTSAAAPLMAAFTADVNESSLGNGGKRMGFANPFLYHEATADPAMFHDVTTGSNNLVSTVQKYHAAVGYDMASGWGSIDVNRMATDLAAYSRSASIVQLTRITGNASRNPVTAGHPSKLSGKLTNTSTHHAMAGQSVWFIGVSGRRVWVVRLHTGPKGGWSKTFTRSQLNKRLQWVALYLGEQGHRPAETPVRTLRIG